MRRVLVALLAGAGLLLAGCGAETQVRGLVDDLYEELNSSGDTVTYRAPTAVPATAQQIAGGVAPAARATDGGTEFLRYPEDIVIVQPSGGQSDVRIEDLDGPYRNGAYRYLGSGFDPGSPAGDIDDDEAK